MNDGKFDDTKGYEEMRVDAEINMKNENKDACLRGIFHSEMTLVCMEAELLSHGRYS